MKKNKKMYEQDTVGYLLKSIDRVLFDDEAWGITPIECRKTIIEALREKVRDIIQEIEKREATDD